MNNKSFWIRKIIGFILLFIICMLALALAVMALWNHVLVAVVNVQPVSYAQALGLLILSKILFGGWKGGGGWSDKKKHWKATMEEKWGHLSEAEKQKIKEEWRDRCKMWGKDREEI